jgi:hypothetical protein
MEIGVPSCPTVVLRCSRCWSCPAAACALLLLVLAAVHVQSKVMLRIEEPNSDFVRLLVRTVVLPAQPQPQAAASTDTAVHTTATAAGGDSDDKGLSNDQDLEQQLEQLEQQEQGETGVQHEQQQAKQQIVPALSPAAVESLLSPASGCEVLLQEESRWLVVSDTFCPGDICR